MSYKLSFSYSKLGLYRECPQKYKFRYILKIPEKPKYYFAFGTALHKVMEFMYAVGTPPFPPVETTFKFFKSDWDCTSWDDKGYASAAKEREGFLEGVRIIKAYYEKHGADNFAPVSSEFRSTVDIDGLSVISIVDRIDYLGGGKISILDYKTGKTLSREPDQLMMYQKLMDNNPKLEDLVKAKYPDVKEVKVANMLFYHLPTLEEQAFEPASKEEIDEFWAGVLVTAGDIKASKFDPDPSEQKCRWCDYKPMCPVWKLSDADATPFADNAVAQKSINPQEDLSSKIDAYGKASSEAEKLKKEILDIMVKNNFSKHFGREFEAELETVKALDFKDHQKTIDVLKKHKLLGAALVPTYTSIVNLMQSGKLTPEQKKDLEATAQTVETLKLNITKTEN
jgi:putative RecB family exonuclease